MDSIGEYLTRGFLEASYGFVILWGINYITLLN
ncbi:hypothetical protein A1F94_013149 [Pyrenophora tritici-repentis]|nr:hypothetical protein A1F99_126000 [Pyrenophora tritici-repentis]KAG9376602.1 hypothetical protein A1F94_013149 [Pyrenophora tritici-repentis]